MKKREIRSERVLSFLLSFLSVESKKIKSEGISVPKLFFFFLKKKRFFFKRQNLISFSPWYQFSSFSRFNELIQGAQGNFNKNSHKKQVHTEESLTFFYLKISIIIITISTI